ncbi:MAG: serine/threonine-protein kinase [Ktedonobacterales bacterium]
MVLLNHRYELAGKIGRGATSTVYRGTDTHTGRPVAIRILRRVYSTDSKRIVPFQQAAEVSRSLRHPNIVQVLDSGQDGEDYYIIMELVEGGDLRLYASSARSSMGVEEAVRIAYEVARGLGCAHSQGVIHAAVKPHKILMGSGNSIKVAGFLSYNQFDRLPLGSSTYSSPEQVQTNTVSPATDIYLLGTILYELLVGHTPFAGSTPEEVARQQVYALPRKPAEWNPNIAPILDEIVMKCLEKVPDERFRNGNELATALEAV